MNEADLQAVATRFWTLLEKSWLQILNKIPETSSVSLPEYKALLPTPAGLRPAAPLRPKDWVLISFFFFLFLPRSLFNLPFVLIRWASRWKNVLY